MKNLILMAAIVASAFLSCKVYAKGQIVYKEDLSETNLVNFVTSNYIESIDDCERGREEISCGQTMIIPPAYPEDWFFINDQLAEAKKYTASMHNGQLAIHKTSLTGDESNMIAELEALRNEARQAWVQAISNWREQMIEQQQLAYLILSNAASECNADSSSSGSEATDSALDYFSNLNLRNGIKDSIQDAYTPGFWDGVNGWGAGAGAKDISFSFNVTYRTFDEQERFYLPDGSYLVFNLVSDEEKTIYLNLENSKTSDNGWRLSDFISRGNGDKYSDNYIVNIKSFNNIVSKCLLNELLAALRAISPNLNTVYQGDGDSTSVGTCEVMSLPRGDFVNIYAVTSMKIIGDNIIVTVSKREERISFGFDASQCTYLGGGSGDGMGGGPQ